MTAIDFDAFYRVDGWDGIAWTLRGHPTVLEDDEWTEDRDHVEAIMVGDDGVHVHPVDALHKITEDEFCHGCGQIGCGH